MKRKTIYWLTSLVLSFLGFFLIEHIFTIKPHVISGNGNLGILVILVFSPVFLASYILTFKRVREKTIHNRKINAGILLFSLLLCAILIAAISNYTHDLIAALGGDPGNRESRIYRFGWFNQYTNSLFFNVYTFLLSHLIVVIFSVLSVVTFRRKS